MQDACRTWWLTGLPGAGKTTLAIALREALAAHGETAFLLDGDELRAGLCSDLGFSMADRTENNRRVAELARLLNASGQHAIVALVSPLREARARARDIVGAGQFIEVHVATPLSVCMQRDPKGLYRRAMSDPGMGMTGPQSTYEAPLDADLTLDTSRLRLSDAVERLLSVQSVLMTS